LFGTLSGLVASFFLGARGDESAELKEILARLRAIEKKLPNAQAPDHAPEVEK